MAYFSTFMSDMGGTLSANEVLPSGIGVNFAYDQGLEYIHQHYMIPGIKIEHSYIYFTKDLFVNKSKEVTGHAAYAGFTFCPRTEFSGCRKKLIKKLDRNNLVSFKFHGLNGGHPHVFQNTQMLKILFAERHPEPYAFNIREISYE